MTSADVAKRLAGKGEERACLTKHVATMNGQPDAPHLEARARLEPGSLSCKCLVAIRGSRHHVDLGARRCSFAQCGDQRPSAERACAQIRRVIEADDQYPHGAAHVSFEMRVESANWALTTVLPRDTPNCGCQLEPFAFTALAPRNSSAASRVPRSCSDTTPPASTWAVTSGCK